MRALGRTDLRLIRHDWSSLANGARATFATWHDRLIAGTIVPLALASMHARAADVPPRTAGLLAAAAGFMLGLAAGYGLRRRLAFHAHDGVLAADALQRSTRCRFVLAWHAIAALLLVAVTLAVSPTLPIYAVPAYAVGAATAIPVRWVPWRAAGLSRWRRLVTRWSRRPVTGASCAIAVLLSMPLLSGFGNGALVMVVFIGTLLISLALTPVDPRVVRFMAVVGVGGGRSIARHATALAAFAIIAVPAGWLVKGLAAMLAICASCTLVGLILSLRILAYRLHGGRVADILVGTIVGLLALLTYALPPALPIAVVGALWHLQRRSAAKTWLLA